jgi:hypothetical protein
VDLIFQKGKWDKVYFVYDEDDDCHRWERVEFLDPLDPLKSDTTKEGLIIIRNRMYQATGANGTWTTQVKGRLYISKY